MNVEDFPDRRYLATVPELHERLSSVTLLDLRPAEDFALGTIEGSRHLDLYGISLNDSSEAPLKAFLAIFPTLFGARGVTREKPVVIFDHETGERAARAVWLLAVLGHPDARILDGGTRAWTAAGNNLARVTHAPAPSDPAKTPPTPPPFKATPDHSLLATRFDVHAAIGSKDTVIVDVRRESEYRGTEKRARRVGTILGPYTSSGGSTWMPAARSARQPRSVGSTSRKASRRTRRSFPSATAATGRPIPSSR